MSLIKISQPNFTNVHDLVSSTNYAKQALDTNPQLTFVYDMRPVDTLGYTYLMRDYLDRQKHSSQTLHLIHPTSSDTWEQQRYGKAGVWLDPRTQTSVNYLTVDGRYILESPADTIFLRDHYLHPEYPNSDHYQAITNQEVMALVTIIPRRAKEHSQAEQEILKDCQPSNTLINQRSPIKCFSDFVIKWEPLKDSFQVFENVAIIQEKTQN